jgi:hypothetical protein
MAGKAKSASDYAYASIAGELDKWIPALVGMTLRSPPPMGAPDEGYPPLCDAPGTYVLE